MFLIGLFIGLIIHAVTYLFSKQMTGLKRAVVVFGLGVLLLVASILVIGGFEGMPVGVLSAGIMTVGVLFSFGGSSVLWRNIVYTLMIVSIVSYGIYLYIDKPDFWIVNKQMSTGAGEPPGTMELYAQRLQQDPAIQGYKVFSLGEGKKGLVLSLGGQRAGSSIEVVEVKEKGATTRVTVRTYYNLSGEKNPYIMVGVDRLQPELEVTDTNGTAFQETELE